MNLRRVTYGVQDDGGDDSPTFIRTRADGEILTQEHSIRFASFVDNMGELLEHDHDSIVSVTQWTESDCHTVDKENSDSASVYDAIEL